MWNTRYKTLGRSPAAALAGTLLLASLAEVAMSQAAQPEQPRVEVVFVLDTTGSMGGLIQAAKEKIWAIANSLATAKPAPKIKMGLVGYRDRGDAYVTKRTELTDDLDAVYNVLMAFQAEGGGDTPESVNQGLHEAVTKIEWSAADKTYRVIFLVGDCPPHMDYQDDVKYAESCKLAATRAIIINTIQCGTHGQTEPIWRDIAEKAEGRYFRVEQSGGAILASTPFDAKLAELSKKLDATRVYYGSREVLAKQDRRDRVAGAIYEKASVSALARRAAFNAAEAGSTNLFGRQELLSDLKTGRLKLAQVKEAELPPEMRKMSAADREKLVKAKLADRARIQAQIKDLAARRQKHIEEHVRKTRRGGKRSLDAAIYDSIKEQAAERGIEYKGGPAY